MTYDTSIGQVDVICLKFEASTQVPGLNVVNAKNIVRRQTRLPSVRNVENTFMCHAQILVRKNCPNKDHKVKLGIAKTAKLNAAFAVVLL